VMNINKVIDVKGFQTKFFKHGLQALDDLLVDLFKTILFIQVFHSLGHITIHAIHKLGTTTD
jgi:hypothetical protein